MFSRPMLGWLACLVAVGCADDSATGGSAPQGGSEPTAGAQAAGGGGAEPAGGSGGEAPFIPDAADVFFAAVTPLPAGESIVFNDWNESPNPVLAMRPDGSDETTVFVAYRIWSMGISADTGTIAFSAGDPEQEAHFGITLGDAIQPTFLYDVASETAENLSYGNINDECLTFSADGSHLYTCRRYDFTDAPSSKGYRLGRIDIASKAFEFITPEDASVLTLTPQPSADESLLYYGLVPVPGDRSVVSTPLPAREPTEIKADASYPLLSPDKTRLLMTDYTQSGSLISTDLNGGDVVTVALGEGLSTAAWSPDGSQVVFLRDDDNAPCAHVEIAAADGSEAASTNRIHDCVESGRFITELQWVDH